MIKYSLTDYGGLKKSGRKLSPSPRIV